MLMPKAAVHEDNNAFSGKHEIGDAGQTTVMQTITKAEGMEKAPHDHFWASIARMHRPHGSAA
jgi:hypothetical protein